MAKFTIPFEDTLELYNSAIERTGLNHYINITVLSNDKAKEIFKVVKSNEITKFRTGDDVFIILNEKVFDQLTDEQKLIVVEESLAGIHYDTEKDRLVLTKPDVNTFSLLLTKYGFDKWLVLQESIRTLYSVEDNSEE